MIDKYSSVPIYLQIEQIISEKISSGELKPGDLIPSEHTMSEHYHVSRMTIRNAIDYLVRQGILERQRGKGTFVCQPNSQVKMALPLDHHLTSSEVAGFLNKPITNKLLHLSQTKADQDIAAILNVKVKTPLWFMKRLRLIGDTPFVFESSLMLADPFSDLTEEDLNHSKYTYLAKHGFHVKGSKKEIHAELPNNEVRKWLELKRDEPVLAARSVAYLEGDIPFEVSDIYYNQHYYTFTLTASR